MRVERIYPVGVCSPIYMSIINKNKRSRQVNINDNKIENRKVIFRNLNNTDTYFESGYSRYISLSGKTVDLWA